ncbi:MAG TPA: alpha/beta fold hydrolase [Kribbellaceae bacterium]
MWPEFRRRGYARLGIVVGLAAALLSPLTASAATDARAGGRAGYCPRYDAYELKDCHPRHQLPDSPVGRQLRWVLDQLAGNAATLTVAEVKAHLSPGLQQVSPAEQTLEQLRADVADRGPLAFVGFAYPPRRDQAVAIVRDRSGERAGVAVSIAGSLIDILEIDEAPPTIVPRGPYSGWFDIGGRRMFLRCTGHGSPTVVFENGLVTDWHALQQRLSSVTRVCSYDPARLAGPWGRSDPATAPRDAEDRVADLRAVLTAARVPGPYVLAGHSNGGLFSLLYASTHPEDVAGLVLIDGVHPQYHRRSIEVAKQFAPREYWDELTQAACGLAPVQVDAEQLDICLAEDQTLASLRAAPLRAMPVSVLTRGNLHFPPGSEPDAQERLWRQLQAELAATVPGSRHVLATDSGHDIPRDQPELVLTEVGRVVTAVREGRTTLR